MSIGGVSAPSRRNTVRLRSIHGRVGRVDQLNAIYCARLENRGADAHTNCNDVIAKPKRLRQVSTKFLLYRFRIFRTAGFRQHDHEFIAAITTCRITPADAVQQAGSHLLQKQVSHIMAELVVHSLEAIEIEQQQSNCLVLSRGLQHRLVEPIEQQRAIGQPREPIVIGEVMSLRHLALQLRHPPQESRIALGERLDSSPWNFSRTSTHAHTLADRRTVSVRYRTFAQLPRDLRSSCCLQKRHLQ